MSQGPKPASANGRPRKARSDDAEVNGASGIHRTESTNKQRAGGKARRQADRSNDNKKKPKKAVPPDWLTPVQAIAKLNRNFCVVQEGGKVRVLTSSEQQGRITLDHLSFTDFRNLHMHQYVHNGDDKNGNPILSPLGNYWLRHSERKQYSRVVFEPHDNTPQPGTFNLWRGWGVEPKAGDWSLMQRHIRDVLAAGDLDHEEYILNFAAWCVQHPAEPAEVALVFRGSEGTGRGIFARALCRIFGQHAHHVSSINHVTGTFNKHLRDCCLLFADEAFWPGYRDQEGNLKRLITEPTLFIEPKGLDAFEVPNMIHLVMVSNNDWVIPAAIGARRFAVFYVSEHHKQEKPWFKALYQQMDSGGLAAMLHDLLARDLKDWHPREIIRTAALRDQQLRSLDSVDPIDAWWFTLLSDGVLPKHFERDDFDGKLVACNNDNPRRAYSTDLFKHARQTVPKLKHESDQALGRALRARGCTAFNYEGRGWTFPPLGKARADYEKKIPGHNWGDRLTDWQERN